MISATGRERIKSDYAAYLGDESKLSGFADEIYFPESCAELSDTLRLLKGRRLSVTLSGARTGIVGGAVPEGGAVVSTEKLIAPPLVFPGEGGGYYVRVGPGTTLDVLNSFLHDCSFPDGNKYFFPVDPTEGSASIGGIVATNASGSRSYRFGSLRHNLAALTVILADGLLVRLEKGKTVLTNGCFKYNTAGGGQVSFDMPRYVCPAVKNNAGYYFSEGMDLIDLFAGSDGTLGAVAEADLILKPRPEVILSVLAFFDTEKNSQGFVRDLRTDNRVVSIEYFDSNSLGMLAGLAQNGTSIAGMPVPEPIPGSLAAIYFEYGLNENETESAFEAFSALLEKHGSGLDMTWGGADDKEMLRLKSFRHAVPEAVNTYLGSVKRTYPGIHKMSTDLAVPVASEMEMFDAYNEVLAGSGMKYVVFGHIGECHLHVNLLPADPADMIRAVDLYSKLVDHAIALGGTVSAEHGIGKLKKKYLSRMYPQSDIDAMLKVKRHFDPGLILNPGNIF